MNVEEKLSSNRIKEKKNSILHNNLLQLNPKLQYNPFYVSFEYNNKKISELIIPDSIVGIDKLIQDKANEYEIDKEIFIDLIKKNKIDLSSNIVENNLDKYDNYNNKENSDHLIIENKHLTEGNNNNKKALNNSKNYLKENYIDNDNKNCNYNYMQMKNNNNNDNNINMNKCDNTMNNNHLHLRRLSNDNDINSKNNLTNTSFHKNHTCKYTHSLQFNNNRNTKNNDNMLCIGNIPNTNLVNNPNNNIGSREIKKRNIIKNLKIRDKKIFEEEKSQVIGNCSLNIKNNYISYENKNINDIYIGNNNNNNGSLSNKNRLSDQKINNYNLLSNQEISSQKIRDYNISDKSPNFSTKSTNVNDVIKSTLILYNNSNEKKINKIFNIKYDTNFEENKYKDKTKNKKKLEFLTDKEKENFSMLYSLNNSTGNFNFDFTKRSEINSENINYSNRYLKDNKSNLNLSNIKANYDLMSNYRQLTNEKTKNKNKLNFRKIKNSKKFVEKKFNLINNHNQNFIGNDKITDFKSDANSTSNLFTKRNNMNNHTDIEKLYNTDLEIVQSNKKRNLLRNNTNKSTFTTYNKNLIYTKKSFFAGKNNSTLNLKHNAKNNINLTFKPKLNSNSIFMNIRSKLSKLMQKELESNNYPYNQNTKKNNFSYLKNKENYFLNSNTDSISNTLRYSEDQFNNTKNLYECNYIDKKNIKNKINLNHTCRTEISISSKSRSRVRSVDEINIITNRLYNYSAKYNFNKKRKQEDYYNSTCPFTPSLINDVYKIHNIKPSMTNFFFRLQNWVNKRNIKYETDYESTFYDNKTGYRLFSPKINKTRNDNTRRNVFF